MLRVINTNPQKQIKHKLTVVHLKSPVSQKESLKADQNSDPGASVMRGFFIDSRSQYVRSNYYPDGPGGNYTGL